MNIFHKELQLANSYKHINSVILQNLSQSEYIRNDYGAFVFNRFNRVYSVIFENDYSNIPLPENGNFRLVTPPAWFPSWAGVVKIAPAFSNATGSVNAYINGGYIYGAPAGDGSSRVMGFIISFVK